jgi:2-keto-4-pentenoate hydratase/2-oxohepta-3-ene-1,7-dioic acid hydratase in catechol pathway
LRLVSFRGDDGPVIGVLRGPDEVLELAAPVDMLSLIDSGDEGMALVQSALRAGRGKVHALADLRLLAPLPNPRGNVIAIGRNYQAHAEESARAAGKSPDPPTVFTKAITSLAGPHDDVVIDDAVTKEVDWEVELGLVVGRAGANIPRERALDHVFGYLVVNDVSARDIQFGWGGQFFKGKSLDGFCPTGPWIVTPDELGDSGSLRLLLRVNGDLKQDGNTRDMIYPVDAILEWVSKGMTLPAGTLIATGTPDGVGFARIPPEFLKPGDLMETEVEKIGKLRNSLVSAGRD